MYNLQVFVRVGKRTYARRSKLNLVDQKLQKLVDKKFTSERMVRRTGPSPRHSFSFVRY
jgi:hypothetical protein